MQVMTYSTVFARCKSSRAVWAVQVQRPTAAEKKKTRWHTGQVYVEYFGSKQVQALDKDHIQHWFETPVPVRPRPDLKRAVQEAVRAVSRGARV